MHCALANENQQQNKQKHPNNNKKLTIDKHVIFSIHTRTVHTSYVTLQN